jgi:hypothetical protein
MSDDRDRRSGELAHFSHCQVNHQGRRALCRLDHEELLLVVYEQVSGRESGLLAQIGLYRLEQVGLDAEVSAETQHEALGRLRRRKIGAYGSQGAAVAAEGHQARRGRFTGSMNRDGEVLLGIGVRRSDEDQRSGLDFRKLHVSQVNGVH